MGYKKTIFGLGILLTITIFWVSVFGFSGSFQGFHLIDDHEIVAIHHQLQNSQVPFWTAFKQWTVGELQAIRFRPVWIFFRLLRIELFQTNTFLWLALNLLIAIMTTWLWFLVGLAMKWQTLIALCFTFMIVLGGQSAIYYRLGTPETLSVLLLALVFYLSCLKVRYYQTNKGLLFHFLQIISVVLLILSKENFILILPALIFFQISLSRQYHSLTWKAAIQRNLTSSIIIFFLLITGLGIIQYLKFSSQLAISYADNFGLDLSRLLPTFYQLSKETQWTFLLILMSYLIFCSIFIFQKKKLLENLGVALVLWALIVIPQLLIYSKSNIYERYLLPALIGYAFLLATNLKLISQITPLINRFFSVLLILIISFSFFSFNYPQFQKYASERRAVHQLLTVVSENTQKDDPILLVINPRSFYEFGISLRKFLAYQFERQSIYLASYGSQDTDFYTDLVQDAEEHYKTLDPNVYFTEGYLPFSDLVDSQQFKSIIIFPPFQDVFLAQSLQWFNAENFDKFQVNLNMDNHFPFTMIGNSKVTIYCSRV